MGKFYIIMFHPPPRKAMVQYGRTEEGRLVVFFVALHAERWIRLCGRSGALHEIGSYVYLYRSLRWRTADSYSTS